MRCFVQQLQSGSVHLIAGRPDDARPLLDESLTLAREIGSPGWTVLGTCRHARLPGGDAEPALEAFAAYEERLEVDMRVRARFLLWRLTGDDAHLSAAREDLDFLQAHAPADRRDSMLAHVPLNRAVRDGDADAPVE